MRVLVPMSLLILALLAPASVLAAPPTHETIWLDDPARDVDESAWATDLCGFEVAADVSGHVRLNALGRGGPGTVDLAVYAVPIDYRNVTTGKVYRARDIGPDRTFIRDGVLYVAVTGRSEAGTGNIGVVTINLETGEVVHESGNAFGYLWDRLCAGLS